jgi:hypothetical protein
MQYENFSCTYLEAKALDAQKAPSNEFAEESDDDVEMEDEETTTTTKKPRKKRSNGVRTLAPPRGNEGSSSRSTESSEAFPAVDVVASFDFLWSFLQLHDSVLPI